MTERIIFFGESPIQATAIGVLEHFHAERNYQGLGNRLIEPAEEVGRISSEIICRERPDGTLRHY